MGIMDTLDDDSPRLPISEEALKLALEIWREQEMAFPGRVRRMNPDEIDHASGAWLFCVREAVRRIAVQQSKDER